MHVQSHLPKAFRLALSFCLLILAFGGQAPQVEAHPAGAQSVTASPFNFAAIAAGGNHTCALTTTGGVKCWGDNYFGQLGDGTTIDKSTPVDVVGLASGVTALAVGAEHTCALMTSGRVKCWGAGAPGQLGDGKEAASSTPVDVVGLSSGANAIAAGDNHTCALIATGRVKCWGDNMSGQLGDGTTTARSTPVEVVGLLGNVIAIAAGGNHTCALTTLGRMKCWGENASGQLGDGTNTDSSQPVGVVGLSGGVTTIASGSAHTCAIEAGGGVKCWGDMVSNTPMDVAGLASGVTGITAGELHTCALTTTGGVKCWGENLFGQLGDGKREDYSSIPVDVVGMPSGVTAIAAGYDHTCALMAGDSVKCWGNNDSGQLGKSIRIYTSIPVDVSGPVNSATAIAAGFGHTCALLSGGVRCWGENGAGQLGDGTYIASNVPVDVSGLTSGVSDISAGSFHTCALLSNGVVKCWGENRFGQLGIGTTSGSNTPVEVIGLSGGMVAIAASRTHTCALTHSGGVKCWGDNLYGQLGDGTTNSSSSPVDVSGLGSNMTAIAAGGDEIAVHAGNPRFGFTCALTAAGSVKCWGSNSSGQLGNGTTADSPVPVDVCADSTCTTPLTGVTSITAGEEIFVEYQPGYPWPLPEIFNYAHTCALLSSGRVKCWGSNVYGELGTGTTTGSTTPVNVCADGNCTAPLAGVTAISAGSTHTCALLSGGEVECWGDNGSGQLGDGTLVNSNYPVEVSGLASNATAITAGKYHTCALASAGRMKCWGSNMSGQLGLGITLNFQETTPVNLESPSLTINYPTGKPGSFFTLTGWNFRPGITPTISINGQVISATLIINPTGSFIFFLDTHNAEPGDYMAMVNGDSSAVVVFFLTSSAPLRAQEGGGQVILVPGWIAPDRFVFLPLSRK